MDAVGRPLLFLDVDGVVNLLGASGPAQRWSFPDGRLLVTPEGIAQRLVDLAAEFDVVWATTWGADAPEVFGPLLGVGSEWAVLAFDDEKWPAIVHAAAWRRFVWVDDNAARDVPVVRRPADVAFTDVDAASVLAVRPAKVGGVELDGPRGLALTVDPGVGLDSRVADVLHWFAGAADRSHGR